MAAKIVWTLIFGAGTVGAGGTAFLLPERLWSNAQTVVIYKKGDQESDNTFLKIGGDEKLTFAIQGTQNTESLIRIGDQEIEHQSLSYLKNTQNNSLWLAGNYKHDSTNWNKGMNQKGKANSGKGTLSLYFLNINCQELMKSENLNKEILNDKIKVECQSKEIN